MSAPTTGIARHRGCPAMPTVGLGLYQIDPAEMTGVVGAAIERGYRLFDTASMYRNEVALCRGAIDQTGPTGLQ